VTSLSEIHPVRDLHNASQAIRLQMIALLDHPAYQRKACTASRLVPRRGKRSKCGRIRPVRSPIARTSNLNVRSLLDSRIQPHRKNARKSSSSLRSLSFRDSEYDGLTSRPARSFARTVIETQKHPSPSVRPETNQGSSGTTSPWAPCLSMTRAGVLRVAQIFGVAELRHASPFGSVVRGSLGLPSGSPTASGRRVSPI
jgi:hypothetical protein